MFRSIFDIDAPEWLAAMKLAPEDVPDVVIVEGSWWRQQRTDWRLSRLSDVRELEFPDIFWGRWQDKKIAFCCAYGAARTVEIIHLFGVLGTKLAVQIGTCGGLQPYLAPGDIILRINELPIEHPEEADAALRSLKDARSLRIAFERDGKESTLELPILGAPAPVTTKTAR